MTSIFRTGSNGVELRPLHSSLLFDSLNICFLIWVSDATGIWLTFTFLLAQLQYFIGGRVLRCIAMHPPLSISCACNFTGASLNHIAMRALLLGGTNICSTTTLFSRTNSSVGTKKLSIPALSIFFYLNYASIISLRSYKPLLRSPLVTYHLWKGTLWGHIKVT